MKRRRTMLICRWLGAVLLVMWGMTFVVGLSTGWNSGTANQFTFTPNLRLNRVDIARGLIHVQLGIKTIRAADTRLLSGGSLGPWHSGRTYIFGDQQDATIWAGKAFTIPATVPICSSAALIGFSLLRRHPKGHCPKCGYDLNGIADQCPECGRMVQAEAP